MLSTSNTATVYLSAVVSPDMTTVWFGLSAEVNDTAVLLESTRMTRKPSAGELRANVACTVTVLGMSAELLAVAL